MLGQLSLVSSDQVRVPGSNGAGGTRRCVLAEAIRTTGFALHVDDNDAWARLLLTVIATQGTTANDDDGICRFFNNVTKSGRQLESLFDLLVEADKKAVASEDVPMGR